MEDNKHICGRCGEEQDEPINDHTCPYSEEINGDYETECRCCSECTYQCCMDI